MKKLLAILLACCIVSPVEATIYLRQSTASQEVLLPRFLDSADGNTEKVSLTIANTDIKLWKTGATTIVSKNSGGATHISNGLYYCVFDATDTNTVGSMIIEVHVAGALDNHLECVVLAGAVYDVQFGAVAPTTLTSQQIFDKVWGDFDGVIFPTMSASDVLLGMATETSAVKTRVELALPAIAAGSANGLFRAGVNAQTTVTSGFGTDSITATSLATDTITAAKIAADAIGASEIAANAINDVEVGPDVTIASVTTVGSVTGPVGSVAGSVQSVTGNVGGNVVGTVSTVTGNVNGNVVGTVATVTGNVNGNVNGNVVGTVATVTGNVNGAVGTVTGNVGGSVLGSVRLSAVGVDDIWDELQIGHTTPGTFGKYLDSSVSGVSTGGLSISDIANAVWNEPRGSHVTVGSFGQGVASVQGNVTGNVTGSVGSISAVTFPTNFGTLGINASGHISRVTLTDTVTTYTGNTPQTGDSFTRIGATGSGLTSLAPSATALSTAVWTSTKAGFIDASISSVSTGGVTAGDIAIAVWNEARSAHVAPGSFGQGVASVTGNVGGNVTGNVTGSVGSISGVTFPTNFGSLSINSSGHISRVVLVDTITTYTGNTVQTGDSFARIGATGSGLTSLAPASTALSTAVWTPTKAGFIDASISGVSSGGVTAAQIADAVLDEAMVGHATPNTVGKLLSDTLADTNELQTDWVNGGRLDLLIDAIKDKSDQLIFTTAGHVDATAEVVLTPENITEIADTVASNLTFTDTMDEPVGTDRTFVLDQQGQGLVGRLSKAAIVGSNVLYGIDFRNDMATNDWVTNVAEPTIVSGTEGGVTFGAPGREDSQAKVKIHAVTAGTYTIQFDVTYHSGNSQVGRITFKVVQ